MKEPIREFLNPLKAVCIPSKVERLELVGQNTGRCVAKTFLRWCY